MKPGGRRTGPGLCQCKGGYIAAYLNKGEPLSDKPLTIIRHRATALLPRTHAIGDPFKEVLRAHDRFNAG